MFTGLIEKVGNLSRIGKVGDGAVLTVEHDPWDDPLENGESVAVHGACLTVTSVGAVEFRCDVLARTMAVTALAGKQPGSRLNLERALKAGARLGGHIVSGHVDGIGRVVDVATRGRDRVLRIECDDEILRDVVPRGSVACDGVSLTVSAVLPKAFQVDIIPFTRQNTCLADLVIGSVINIETDMLGKYVRRHLQQIGPGEGLSTEALRSAGFL